MATRSGGNDRISTKSKLSRELGILGDILVSARERAGLLQAEVASTLGLPPSYLSKIESGTRRVDPIELIRIAEAIGEDPAELIRELQQELQGL
jgi:transcriptional regulator with XRE-family HTH domain